jgi:hypothetical protein
MAIYWSAKTPTQVIRYNWLPDLVAGDTLASATVTATGATVDLSSLEQESVAVLVSGGTAGETASFAVLATTVEGETLTETIYLPIIASAAQIAHTAREYVTFALRRVIGNGETPSADEMTDALERLNAMVAEWRAQGADIGAAFPIVAETVIYCPDYAVPALRYNLLLDVASLYGEPVTQMEAMKARQGLSLVKNMNVPEDRAATYF